MIDRASFDRQINEIRTRYAKLINSKEDSNQKKIANTVQETSSQQRNNDVFMTPIKTREKYIEEQFESFSKSKQIETKSENITKGNLTSRNPKINLQSLRPNFQEERVCLTSRKQTSGSIQLSARLTEKEKKLIERMKQNEKLLRRSKELRDKEEGGKRSQEKYKKENIQQKKDQFCRSKIKDKQNLFLRKKLILQHVSNQKTEYCQTERQKRYCQTTQSFFQNKIKESKDSPMILKEKRNFNTLIKKENQDNYDKCQNTIEEPLNTDRCLATVRQQQRKQIQKEYGEVKIKSVFQNTAKIQERIKALLSLH